MELERMREVLDLEGVAVVPDRVTAKKYFALRLAPGQVAGTIRGARSINYRRNHLVRVTLRVNRRTRGGRVEQAAATVYGAVHHFALVFVGDTPMVFAEIECVISCADRRGTYGLPEQRRDTHFFTSLGGRLRYVNVLAIDAIVGTLDMAKKHGVLCCRDRFSPDS